jgi:hypothetical protein
MALFFQQKNPIQYIKECTNIGDFIWQAEKGVFSGMVALMPDGTETPLHRSNRVIAVKKEFTQGEPRKYRVVKGVRGTLNRCANTPEFCRYYNEDFRDYDFEKDVKPYIDYSYYFKTTAELLNYNFLRMEGQKLYKEEI